MVKGEWSFTHFQDHLSFVAIADAAGAASGNTTAEVPEADACSRGGRRDAALLSALALPPEGSAGRDHPTVSQGSPRHGKASQREFSPPQRRVALSYASAPDQPFVRDSAVLLRRGS